MQWEILELYYGLPTSGCFWWRHWSTKDLQNYWVVPSYLELYRFMTKKGKMNWLAKVEFFGKCFEWYYKSRRRVLHWSWPTANDFKKQKQLTTSHQTTKKAETPWILRDYWEIYFEISGVQHLQSLETKEQIPLGNFFTCTCSNFNFLDG